MFPSIESRSHILIMNSDPADTHDSNPADADDTDMSENFRTVPASLGAKMELRVLDHHLHGEIGDRWGCPKYQSGNNCMFMSLYLSYDDRVRSVLRDGHQEPPDGFRKCNYKTNPGKNGEGEGYNISHLIRYLDYLHKSGKIAGYKVACIKKHKKDWDPLHFLTRCTKGKTVGSRYLLFGKCPERAWWCPTAEGKKRKIGTARLEDCVHPMCWVPNKKGETRLAIADDTFQYPKNSDIVLKQEIEMYKEVTTHGDFTKKTTWGHCTTVAYYPNQENSSKKCWSHSGLVPVIFDNGKEVSKECTPKNLMECIYDVYAMYSVSIELNE